MADPVAVPTKNPFVSKRFYLNVIGIVSAVAAYFGLGFAQYLAPDGAVVLGLFSTINLILAFTSKGQLSLGD